MFYSSCYSDRDTVTWVKGDCAREGRRGEGEGDGRKKGGREETGREDRGEGGRTEGVAKGREGGKEGG